MPRTLSAADLDLDLETQPARILTSEDPFRVALLGDFGGRAHRNEPRLRRDPILVDARNFESVMERLGAGLHLGTELILRFRELDDFHPDRIFQTVPAFETLRQARAALTDSTTFRAAANAPAGNLLDEIVPSQPADISKKDVGASLDEAIRRIVEPHLLPKPDSRQAQAVAAVDEAISAVMRSLLGHPHFQALEAAWRSVFFLLQRMRTGDEVKLYLIDITREEIVEAARSGHPQLIAREPWSAAACLHSFQPNEEDFGVLACLAGLARKLGGPLIAGMHPRLVGCESLAATPDPDDWKQPLDESLIRRWEELRRHPDARWLGLAMPRILLRRPYGAETSPTEGFEFEEMGTTPEHEAYLWGSPAVGCICLLGQAFHARGWGMHAGLKSQIDGLQVHNYRADGELRMTPAAETWLTDRATEKILEAGVMPLASSRSTDAVILVRSQSIADPASGLAGSWG